MEKIDATYYASLIELKKTIQNNKDILHLDLRRDDVFEIFAKMFRLVDNDEKSFITDLMKSYIHIKEYTLFINKICDHIETNFSGQKIALCPVMAKGGVKSGHSVVYETKSILRKSFFKSVSIYDSKDKLMKNESHYDSIIVLDDFIGSGNQAETFIKSAWDEFSRIHIMTIVIQQEAIERLSSTSKSIYNVFPARGKSVTGPNSNEKLRIDEAKRLYENIEKLLDVSEKYKYGYEQVEALVSMKRTPNDTLPIFWCGSMKSGDSWPCPFERI